MGWLVKAGAFMFALFASMSGVWIIALPIFAWLFILPVMRRSRSRSSQNGGEKRIGSDNWINAIGAILIMSSIVAYFDGGTFSPIVFFAAGLALLLRHRFRVQSKVQFVPIEQSILLRSRLNPFHWSTVVEAKISTRDAEGALSGISDRLLLLSAPTPRILLVFFANSIGRNRAEGSLLESVRSTAKALAPLGVYLLPLDSIEAAAATRLQAVRISPKGKELHHLISSSNFGAVAIEARHGFVDSFELYSRQDQKQEARSLLSGRTERDRNLLTVRELLHGVLQKVGIPHPDEYTSFLSSVAATEGETLGQRVTQAESEGPQVLLVTSLGSPRVELKRWQLRAATVVYE